VAGVHCTPQIQRAVMRYRGEERRVYVAETWERASVEHDYQQSWT